jgi:SAM-dependent methyltransferase
MVSLLQKAVRFPRRALGLLVRTIRKIPVKKVVENGSVYYRYRGERYPEYLNRGNACRFIADKARVHCRGTGLDIGADQWPLPGARPIQDEPRLNAYQLDAIPDGSQDFVFSSHCLEHLDRWQQALALWIDKLKGGGVLFLYLPHASMALWRPGGPWVGSAHKWQPRHEVLLPFLEGRGMEIIEYNSGRDDYFSFHIICRRKPGFVPVFPTPPVLFIVFARPELTARVFETIRAARPSRLFIAQDGPRANHPEDIENCRKTREIAAAVDWPCEVKTLFQTRNLGVGIGCSTAIRWFFENVEEGIILEDDVLPEPTFFPYCAELLERYRYDTRVMHIAGYNPLLTAVGDASYYFSPLMHCWGWATWRRVALQYDHAIADWPALKASGLMRAMFRTRLQQRHFEKIFDLYHRGAINNWDQQWLYLILSRGGLCANPCVNLVRNIGFGPRASNAGNPWTYHGRRQSAPMAFPLHHPEFVLADPRIFDRILRKAYKVWGPRLLAVRLAQPFVPWIMKVGYFFIRNKRRREPV